MGVRKKSNTKKPQLVRRTVTVDAEQLKRVREALELRSDADVLRFALEHLLSHFEHSPEGEE